MAVFQDEIVWCHPVVLQLLWMKLWGICCSSSNTVELSDRRPWGNGRTNRHTITVFMTDWDVSDKGLKMFHMDSCRRRIKSREIIETNHIPHAPLVPYGTQHCKSCVMQRGWMKVRIFTKMHVKPHVAFRDYSSTDVLIFNLTISGNTQANE